MSPPGTYDTPGWGELLEPSATMTQVSDAVVSLTELSDNIVAMTSLTDIVPSYTELSDIGVVVSEIPDNVDDYNLSAAGMWDWVFSLLNWNNIGNTWSGSWQVPQPYPPSG
jgi:hypothetical protein